MHQRKLAAKPRRNLTPEQRAKDHRYNLCKCGRYKGRASLMCWFCRTNRNRTEVSEKPFYIDNKPCRYIALTHGHVAIVSEHRYNDLSRLSWYPVKGKHTFYAAAYDPNGRTYTMMHNAVTGTKGVDHKNGNGLDNRDDNLRACTQSQNNGNSRPRVKNLCGFKGVKYRPESRLHWEARIGFEGKSTIIGNFATAEEAAKAYDRTAVKVFGQFARLNFTKPKCAH